MTKEEFKGFSSAAQQSSGNFMSCKSSTDTTSYPDELVKRS